MSGRSLDYELWVYGVRWRRNCTPKMTGKMNLKAWFFLSYIAKYSAIPIFRRMTPMWDVRSKFASSRFRWGVN